MTYILIYTTDGSRVAVGVASSISPAPSNPTSDSSNSWLTTDSQCVCTLFTPNLYNNGTERTTGTYIYTVLRVYI